MSEQKISVALPDSYFAIINIDKKIIIHSLHKIMEKIVKKIKISLACSVFSKTNSEDQGINLMWPNHYR